jgi:hypothetical protein
MTRRMRMDAKRCAMGKGSLLVLALLLTLSLTSSPSSAADTKELARLFPREVDVRVPPAKPPGLLRLRLPAEVLRSTRGDLADLRLFDGQGHEVPFIVDSASRALWSREREVVQLRVVPRRVTQRRVRHDERTQWHEELIVETPREPPPSGRWALVFSSPRPHFVNRLKIVDDDDTERVLVRGTLFRLQRPLREGLRIALPAQDGGALPKRIRVILRGEQAHLEPSLRFESVRAPSPVRLRLPLEIIAREKRERDTVVTVRRPRGIVVDRLELATTTGSFFRLVTVHDAGQGAVGTTLGEQTLFRVADLEHGERLGTRLSPAQGDQLRVVIDDGDSPQLDKLELIAEIDQPALLFELDGPGLLRFGGGRAHAPGYDLQRLVGSPVGRRLAHEAQLTDVELGATRDNPVFDPAPALDYLLRAGPAVEAWRFSHRRRIEVKAAREGLSRLRLLPEDLAHARPDLGDLRVVDDDGHQWPFLLERADVFIRAAVSIGAAERAGRETRYALSLPASPLSLSAIELRINERYIDRPFRVLTSRNGREHTVTTGHLRRRPGAHAALRIELPSERFESLTLVIEDGNDPPLRLLSAEAELPSADVFIAARDGQYWLLLGDSRGEAAQYQMAHARDLVLALPSADVIAGAFEANPEYRAPEQGPKKLLWASLVVAVVALGGLTLRLSREDSPDTDSEHPPSDSEREATDSDSEAPSSDSS